MHFVYDTRTGDVIDGPVTGGNWGPNGIPDDRALVNVPQADREHMGVFKLPDSDGLVATIMEWASQGLLRYDSDGITIREHFPTLTLADEQPPTIPADGETSTTVVYKGPGETITFDVNGVEVDVEIEDGEALLDVTSATPGPIEVTVPEHGLTLTITAEVPA